MCVCGAVDGGDGGVRHSTASCSVILQGDGGEQQVDSSFIILTSSSTLPSCTLLLLFLPRLVVVMVVLLLWLQLKAQGGVQGDDATAGGSS